MTERDWEPLRTLGFDERACLEVAHVVGIFNYLTRLADGLGLALDPGTSAAGSTGQALERGRAAGRGRFAYSAALVHLARVLFAAVRASRR
jgi:hypothetical protein